MAKATITLARLRELLHYDPETGLFTWRVRRERCQLGGVAGTIYPDGYHYLWVDWGRYKAHRLAWFYMTGQWPKDEIDHIDCNRSNNAFANLREATGSQNHFRINGKRPIRGVYLVRPNRWRAMIGVRGKDIHLGYFDSAEEAQKVRRAADKKYFGEFAD